MIKWSAKIKVGKEWEPIPLAVTAGQTLRSTLEWMADKEVVCQFNGAGGLYFFCGTEKWRLAMTKRGKAVLAKEAIELLEKVNPALLDEVGPLAEYEAAFPGSALEQMEIAG